MITMQSLERALYCGAILITVGACANPDRQELTRLALRVDSLAQAITVLGHQAGLSNQAPTPTQIVRTSLDAGLRTGPGNSEFVLVEFTDYYCPYCATFAVSAMPDIIAGAPDLEVVVRNYPILEIHPKASALASRVECVADSRPESAWAVRRRLFARQAELPNLDPTTIDQLFEIVPEGLEPCLSRENEHARVTRDRVDAARLRLRGTPALILGRRVLGDSIEGMLLQGAYPASEVLRLLDSLKSEGRVSSRVPYRPRDSPTEGL